MVHTNANGCSSNAISSNRTSIKNLNESNPNRSSLGLRQSQSSDSGHSEASVFSIDRLKSKFEAAVQLIQNLPTQGAFQPSDEVKLRYYALYKQATVGANKTPKPAFYDLVAKYKWEAWKSLGDISKETAMQTYIDELIKSIQEMPKTSDNDSELQTKLAPYLSVLLEEENKDEENIKHNASDGEISGSNGYEDETGSESEEFSDAHDPLSEQSQSEFAHGNRSIKTDIICARGETGLVPNRAVIHASASTGNLPFYSNNSVVVSGYSSNVQANRVAVGGNGNGRDGGNYRRVMSENSDNIAYALLNLQRQVDTILSRVDRMEGSLNRNIMIARSNFPKWWPLDISPTTTFLLMGWPFIAQYIMNRIKNRAK